MRAALSIEGFSRRGSIKTVGAAGLGSIMGAATHGTAAKAASAETVQTISTCPFGKTNRLPASALKYQI